MKKYLLAILLVLCLIMPASARMNMMVVGSGTGGETTLNTGNTYGQNTVLMYLFDDGEGSSVTDYSGNSWTGAVNNATWESNGMRFDAASEFVKVLDTILPVTTAGSVFILFTSTSATGATYSKFWVTNDAACTPASVESMCQRQNSEITLAVDLGEGSSTIYYTVPDLWDQSLHDMLISWDNPNDERRLFIDGSQIDVDDTNSINPYFSTNDTLYIGDICSGSYALNMVLHAFYVWTAEYGSSDATSLHGSPYQMFNNPPSR